MAQNYEVSLNFFKFLSVDFLITLTLMEIKLLQIAKVDDPNVVIDKMKKYVEDMIRPKT